MSVPLPLNEEERLRRLAEYGILDTEPEKAFDDIARLAAQICGCPIAAVTLIDRDRQWFKSILGVPIAETPRDVSFCTHAILDSGLTHVADAALDPRFRDNPFVTGDPHLRFYAGAPLVTADGAAMGTLCVFDRFPRDLSPEQRQALEHLSRVVVTHLDLRKLAAGQRRALAAQAHLTGVLRQREHQLQTLTDNVPACISRVDAGRRYVFANRAYQDRLGVPLDQVIGRTLAEVLGEAAYATVRPYVDRVLSGETVGYVADIDYRSVGRRTVHTSYVPEHGPQGEVTGFVLCAQDITDHQREARARAEAEARLAATVSDLPVVIWAVDAEGVFTFSDGRALARLGLRPGEAVGRSLFEMYAGRPDMLAYVREAFAGERSHWTGELGGVIFEAHVTPLRDGAGRVTGLLGVSQDITERKALEAERERLLADLETLLAEMETLLAEATERADRDPLTGLLNHRAFQRRFQEEADRAQREGCPLAVAMLDLDNFKFFNDAYGHLAGDDVLRRVAEVLRRQCRSYDTVARFGGDEFAVLMPGLSAAAAACLTRRTLQHLGEQGYVPPGGDAPVPLGLSAGVAVFPTEAPSRLDVLALADERLRLAKSGGDEAVIAALDVRAEMSRRIEGFTMLDALVAAVDNKDRYTRRHSEGVLAYSLEIACALGLDEKTQRTVATAALLHDVGKIGVPDAVLRKPGKLTDDEFEAMKQHPMMGAVMVGAVPGFEDTLDAVRHHHERWDGGGYPFGLRGEETPLLARLLAVADAFSAMTTDRPYRKALPEAKALSILEQGAGTQWDPQCVRAFLEARSAGPPTRAVGLLARPAAPHPL